MEKNPFICGVCESVFSGDSVSVLTFVLFFAGRVNGERMIERVALVMTFVPCRCIDLRGQA